MTENVQEWQPHSSVQKMCIHNLLLSNNAIFGEVLLCWSFRFYGIFQLKSAGVNGYLSLLFEDFLVIHLVFKEISKDAMGLKSRSAVL